MTNTVQARVIEAINDGTDLAVLFTDLLNQRQFHADMTGQSIGILARAYLAARDGGVDVTQADPAMNDFMASSVNKMLFELQQSVNANIELAAKQLSALVTSIGHARRSGVVWSMPVQPAAPMPVYIAGMVGRVTTTEVNRDPKSMEITGSVQIAKDVE
jgi:hypothetical protein